MLKEAVESVLSQTYRPIEIIIVNDGSTDNTLAVAEELKIQNSNIIEVLDINNSGVGRAREVGRIRATGEYIQYLDSDDLLHQDKFSLQIKALNASPNAGACYGKTDMLITKTNTLIESCRRTGEEINNLLPSMLTGRWWGTSSALFRRNISDEAGPWQNLINEEDWEYECRYALINNVLCYVPQTVSTLRQHQAEHLSFNGAIDTLKLKSRADARLLIIGHAINYGVSRSQPEFKHLLKSSFLLARQCAAQGLKSEAKSLISCVRKNLDNDVKEKLKVLIYLLGSSLIGWGNMGNLMLNTDKYRHS